MKLHEILKEQFQKKRINSGYSMRALARDLKLSPAFISNVFSGKKKLPLSRLQRFIKVLDIDNEMALEIRQLLSPHNALFSTSPNPSPLTKWKPSSRTEIFKVRQWFYMAIMELVSCKNFDGTIPTIASRLGIAETSVEVAVRDLVSGDLLEMKDNKIQKKVAKIRMSSSSSMEEIRRLHRQFLRKAEEELSKVSEEDFQKRLITGITITASPEKIDQAKKMLSDALHEIADLLTEEEGSEVYHLAAQLFPLTR